ncbi:MAG TPA: tectonin domain-containing protein [Bryobacteraceae bacterium]|nr:tectonin domain-containing protein [Bryobacteraceae bacterium]
MGTLGNLLTATGLTICLASAVMAQSSGNALPFEPVNGQIQFSPALQCIIFLSQNPNQLHIYDPVANSDRAVNLSAAPLGVSVAPDGVHAAVAQNNLVSYVDLQAGSVIGTYTTSENESNIVLSSSYAYLFPSYNGDLVSINLSTGQQSTQSYVYSSGGRLDPPGDAIYGTEDGISPNSIYKFDVSAGSISNGFPITVVPSWNWGTYSICSPVWFSPDGARIYDGCGTVFASSPNSAQGSYYVGSLTGMSQVQSLDTSATMNQVAAIPSASGSFGTTVPDDYVSLYDARYLQPLGQFYFTKFTVNANIYDAHGRSIFFNADGSKLFAVVEADATSGLLNDYAVQTIDLVNAAACNVTLASTSASAIGSGAPGSVGITAGTGCVYSAVSNAAWIQVTAGGYGSGNGTLQYIVRPNPDSQSRTGTVTIANATLTITQAAAPASAAVERLGFEVASADYSRTLGRLILASSSANELHIYDPATQADQIVALPKPVLSLSVSPGGLYAAVGHDGWVSYVNLQTASLSGVWPAETTVQGLVLSDSGYAYLFSEDDQAALLWLNMSSGAEANTNAFLLGNNARMHPSDAYFYTAGSPPSRWAIGSDGTPSVADSSLQANLCANFWITQDGTRLVNACAQVLRSSTDPASDFEADGSLSGAESIVWATHSTQQQSIAVIVNDNLQGQLQDTQIQIYGDASLALAGQTTLPEFSAGGSSYAGHGRYLFWNAAENGLVAVEQADSSAGLSPDYGVAQITEGSGNGCTISLASSSFHAADVGGPASVGVTAGEGCGWASQSNAAWVTITAGQFGFGDGSISFTLTPNGSGQARTGTVTIAGQTFTINEDSSPAGFQATPGAVSFGTQSLGAVSGPQTIRFSNPGIAPLALASVVISGPDASEFSIQSSTCGASLAAGQSCSTTVVFAPQGSGTRTASLVVTDTAADSPQTISFSGMGTGPLATSVPGELHQIAVGADGTVWGLNSAGEIFTYNTQTQTWTNAPGTLAQIAVGSSNAVWGLNQAGLIFRWDAAKQGWDWIPGALHQIAVGADGDVWGVNAQEQIYRFNAQTQGWTEIPGSLTQIAVGFDGAVWGVNANDSTYRYNVASGEFKQTPATFTSIAVGADGEAWGVNNLTVYHFDRLQQAWVSVQQGLAQISVGAGSNVWALDSSGAVYRYDADANQFTATGEAPLTRIAAGGNGALWGLDAEDGIHTYATEAQPSGTFHQVSGLLTQIAVGADNTVWGVGVANQIYTYNAAAQSWTVVPGALAQIAVGRGDSVWGINAGQQIFRHNAQSGGWDYIPGALVQIAVGANGDVWGINEGEQTYHFNSQTGGWTWIPGELRQIAVGDDGAVWGINDGNAVYRFNARMQMWSRVPGTLVQIAVGSSDSVWGVNSDGGAYHFNPQTQSWQYVPGVFLKEISVGYDGAVWGVTASGQVFELGTATGTWAQIQGSLDQVVVGADGAVWGIKAGGALYYR